MTTQPLPETTRPNEYRLEPDTALADYQTMKIANPLQVAKAVGVHMQALSYRIYGDRLMWRLLCTYDTKLTNDEVRRVLWDLAVKGFGAFKPDFFRGDDPNSPDVVVVWFTDGGRQALQGIKF